METLKPPASSVAPIGIGIGGRSYEPSILGEWCIDNAIDANDLRRMGWTSPDAVSGPSPDADPELIAEPPHSQAQPGYSPAGG